MPLARRLNLTRTGFYCFFKGINELHLAMIKRWEKQNTEQLVKRCEVEANNICEALFNLMDCWLDPSLFDARLNLAIRNWARNYPHLQHRLQLADATRIDAVKKMYERFGYRPEQFDVRALAVIYTQIGYISMQVIEDWDERLARVPQYVEMFSSAEPNAEDVNRFFNRHTYQVGHTS